MPQLETLENPRPRQGTTITLEAPLRCLCPVNGRHDEARLTLRYAPAERLLEYAALRGLLDGLREERLTHELATHRVLEAVVEAARPRWAEAHTVWAPIEGVGVTVQARWPAPEEGGPSST
jgi:NADPH-dependent 7-cyano-7-deazaguanine reductase QueF